MKYEYASQKTELFSTERLLNFGIRYTLLDYSIELNQKFDRLSDGTHF